MRSSTDRSVSFLRRQFVAANPPPKSNFERGNRLEADRPLIWINAVAVEAALLW
jgi:hypothetical protein